ncbi:MAG: MaoC/PaaZ C-terminal domain-containing protein [Desulfobacterales bacterium]|jgi:acyl dehydratase|nr:MaoC/PaaZ C-terminal domain-containing protein [Desulfobacterales bacterium]MDD3082985.1 MaoC/PaaZ C-terminal domain-containing protein [Desulfobacterales bacterium]MDD3951831.1 MaoC/PaaZ C-terminal domain-containing protein [Desulfobacterales bacterium]MDD4464734.1 MaoC/PaaZ C-terminal domain-containing protein [Desulfobacterales bacterium]MDY0378282.1 MaoC/PaaZ C-terminal domain-containing protein [Desulfobacterales bacterium]
MALNPYAQGKPIGPLIRSYSWKDVVLYGLGVGCGRHNLEYCYEKRLKVLPSFSITAIFDLFEETQKASNFNPNGVLHGEQELILHNPIPVEGALRTEARIARYYDKGREKGALVVVESDTYGSEKLLFTSRITFFARLDGGFGGQNAPKKSLVFPDKSPDAVYDDCPGPDQPLIYRLSGDLFPLHVEPEFARKAGFEKPIMHGLCTFGFACRHLIDMTVPGAPEKVKRLGCRFSKPLYPGIPIQTRLWRVEKGKALWRTVNMKTGETVIDNGIFEFEA